MASIRKFSNRALKRGGHTLILGWSPVAVEVIKELTIANENVRKPRIVVLSQTSPAVVEAQLAGLDLGRQKFRIFEGNPASAAALELAYATVAKSIIDLNSKLEYLEDLVNQHAGEHPALAVAIDEILSFEGEEIYFNELPALFGKTYADAVLAFNTASVIGAVIDGEPVINPAAGQVLPHGSQIIALAEDDDQVIYTGIREDALAKLDLAKAQALPAVVQKHADATEPVANLKAKLLAQISENSDLLSVFEGLFAAEGASIGLLPVANFAAAGQAIELADVAVAGISKGYSVIGYFDAASGGVALNPPKNARITPAEGDALIVVGTFAA